MVTPDRIRGETYWRTLLDAIYDGLEGRSVTGYAWADSDGWTRSRTPTEWRSHLECWIDLGGAIRVEQPHYRHEGRLVFAARYHADSDAVSQARLHASIRDAAEYLLAVRLPDGARIVDLSQIAIEGVYEGGWIEVTIGFTLLVRR